MGEFEQVKPYTQAELNQQAIWANEFDQWWESEGQYHRAGGNEYCRTFAWWAWLNREQWQQSKIEQLEKINSKNSNTLQHLEHEYLKLEKRIEMITKSIDSFFDEQTTTLSSREYSNFIADVGKALRGECE